MKSRIPVFLLSLLLFSCLLSGCAGAEERSFQAGQNALAAEDYSAAIAAFEKAASLPEAESLLRYAQAWQALTEGDYTSAESGFRALGDFKDCALMLPYCSARRQESAAQSAFSSGDAEGAVSASLDAASLYSSLPLFRDSDERAAACRTLLYDKATEWMNLGNAAGAETVFAALGDYLDSASLRTYCQASQLETQEQFVEAAALFATVPETLDAKVRSESANAQAYDRAAALLNSGDYEGAVAAFSALGAYRDAPAQRDSATLLLVRSRLQAGTYAQALQAFAQLSDLSVFPAPDADISERIQSYLPGFVNNWMYAHAGVLTGFFSRSILQSYLVPGSELEGLLQAELTDDLAPQNFGFVFLGASVGDLRTLDSGFLAAKVSGSASCFGPAGPSELSETLWVLLDVSGANPAVLAVLPA